MFRVYHRWRKGVCPFHYFTLWRDLSNNLSSEAKWDRMQNLCPQEVYVPIYNFKLHETVGYHHFQRYGIGPFHYCSSQWDIFNHLLTYPNGDLMQKLHCPLVDVPTYHFEAQKMVSVSYSRVMFSIHPRGMNGVSHFFLLLTLEIPFQWSLEWPKWGSYAKIMDLESWHTSLPL